MFYCSFVSIHYIICECGETFPTEDDLRLHLEKEHPHKKEKKEFKCGVCDKTFSLEEECVRHYEEAHIDLDLDQEGTETDDVFLGYTDPNEVEVQIQGNVVQKVVCEFCGEVYASCTTHICSLKFEPIESEAKVRKYKQPKNIVCEVCGRKYTSNAALRYHQRVHTGERPYKCHMCEKTFTMPLFLKVHVRTHTGEKPYQCLQCPKAFSNKAALLRHDRVHTGVKPYKCPKCGKAFSQSNSMKLHVSTVHLKMPAPYKSKYRKMMAMQRVKNNSSSDSDKKGRSNAEIERAVKSVSDLVNVKEESDEEKVVVKSESAYDMGEAVLFDEMGNEVTYEVVYD